MNALVSDPPAGFVRKVNRLGFVLVEGEKPFTFVRLTSDGELRLLIEVTGEGWRVGLAARAADQPGRLPNPVLSVSLAQYGKSSDGLTLHLSTAELLDDLPRMLRDCVLPSCDLAPS
jgi:hypothetical protein